MSGIGAPELLITFLLILVVFGPSKIPEVARTVGKGMREFRRLTTEFQREIHLSDLEEDAKPSKPKRHTERSLPGGVEPRGAATTTPEETPPSESAEKDVS